MQDELELGYLLAVSGAAVWTPRPLVTMLATLGSARAVADYAKAVHATLPPACEVLGAEALGRVAAVNDDVARRALEEARADGQRFVTSSDRNYPTRLRDLCDPPPVLYYRGRLEALDGRTAAIVGSRAATPYGARWP